MQLLNGFAVQIFYVNDSYTTILTRLLGVFTQPIDTCHTICTLFLMT